MVIHQISVIMSLSYEQEVVHNVISTLNDSYIDRNDHFSEILENIPTIIIIVIIENCIDFELNLNLLVQKFYKQSKQLDQMYLSMDRRPYLLDRYDIQYMCTNSIVKT